MPAVKLDGLSIPELRNLIKDIEREIKQREVETKKQVLIQMKELAGQIGMTVEEVLGARGNKVKKTRGKPKYRNPADSEQTWTGKGKRPTWLKDAIQSGKTLQDMEIG